MNEKPVKQSGITTTILPSGHVVLMCEGTDWAYTLTPIGALAWEFCDGLNSAADICSKIAELPEFNDVPVARNQIEELLQELDDAGLFQ
jgi:hypothetical protein